MIIIFTEIIEYRVNYFLAIYFYLSTDSVSFSKDMVFDELISYFEYFNYYCEESPFSAESLPAPKATGITELSHIDPNIFGRKYVRIGVVRNGIEQVSNELLYGYDRPYAVHSANIQGEFGTRWNFKLWYRHCTSSLITLLLRSAQDT